MSGQLPNKILYDFEKEAFELEGDYIEQEKQYILYNDKINQLIGGLKLVLEEIKLKEIE